LNPDCKSNVEGEVAGSRCVWLNNNNKKMEILIVNSMEILTLNNMKYFEQ
jgi:hypothetical protein